MVRGPARGHVAMTDLGGASNALDDGFDDDWEEAVVAVGMELPEPTTTEATPCE